MKQINFTVICPRDFETIRSMTIYLSSHNNASYFPLPCTGCDFANGSVFCSNCIDSIFKMSLKDPTMDSYHKPIVPRILTE